MPELTMLPEAGLSRLKDGLSRLAREKAQLARLGLLTERLKERPGPGTVVAQLLQLVTEDSGSRNAALFYRIDDALYRLNARGSERVGGEVEDGLVRYVFETHESVSRENAIGGTGMTATERTGGVTRVLPLLAGAELVGVLRLDDLSGVGQEACDGVQPVLPFAAAWLRNEIAAAARGGRAFDEAGRESRNPGE